MLGNKKPKGDRPQAAPPPPMKPKKIKKCNYETIILLIMF